MSMVNELEAAIDRMFARSGYPGARSGSVAVHAVQEELLPFLVKLSRKVDEIDQRTASIKVCTLDCPLPHDHVWSPQ